MKHHISALTALAAALATMMVVSPAQAFETVCYDAKVSARIRDEVPTVIPDIRDESGAASHIDAWPWIVDLNVQQVREGNISDRRLRVLTIQNTYFQHSTRDYYLRRNHQGGWNVIWPTAQQTLTRCANDSQPARAYFTPANGKTLEDARREGRRSYER